MAGTTNIPLVTLTVGSHDLGPASVANGDSQTVLTLDRTVANGFNSRTSATQVTLSIQQSNDGGATWNELASADIPGGVYTKNGVTITSSSVSVSFWPGTNRQVKGNVTVTGSSVAVQGTLTTS